MPRATTTGAVGHVAPGKNRLGVILMEVRAALREGS